jgi:DoxX
MRALSTTRSETWIGRARAAIASFSITPFQRIEYLRTAVVLGFAAGFLLSYRLWISSRFYPLIPIVRGLRPIPYPLDYLCAVALLVLLFWAGMASKPRVPIFSFSALLLFLAVFDQTRWQPWTYLYLFLLLSLAFFSWDKSDVTGQVSTLNICRLIVAATYFYSGLQKMNVHFAAIGVKSLAGPFARFIPMPHFWPWIIAAIESSIGIGLLTRKYRNSAVICGVLMHLFVLFSDVVLMHWNSVVWPWNLTMMALLVFLFWRSDFSVFEVLWRNPIWFQKVALVLFVVMPFFSFFGWWDSYLSASLYSANVAQANLLFRGDVKDHLPPPVAKYVERLPAATNRIIIRDWSNGELNVPPYPALRAFRAIGAQVCKYADNSPDVKLVMLEKDTWLEKGRETSDTCLGTLMVDKW